MATAGMDAILQEKLAEKLLCPRARSSRQKVQNNRQREKKREREGEREREGKRERDGYLVRACYLLQDEAPGTYLGYC